MGVLRIWGLSLALAWVHSAWAPPVSGSVSELSRLRDSCLRAMRSVPPPRGESLPVELDIGAESIHREPARVVTIFVPVPRSQRQDLLLDMNAKGSREIFPPTIAVSDGGRDRSLLGIDTRPGRPLRACLDVLASALKPQVGSRQFYPSLLKLVSQFMALVPNSGLPWDSGLPGSSESDLMERLFKDAFYKPVGHFPLTSPGRPIRRKVIPLEAYLQAGQGYCIQKALFAALLLERLGIPHRVTNGATASSGHTWIELDSGEWFDPTWGLFERPRADSVNRNWKLFGSSALYKSQMFPYLSLAAE